MRSQLVLLSIVSLAIAGCGKSVERSAQATNQAQQNGSPIDAAGPVETRPGMCQDPIPSNLKKVERFSDISAMAGAYKLTSFDAVGLATSGAGPNSPGVAGISVAKGIVAEDGSLKYEEKCRDLNSMPSAEFEWTGVAAGAIDAKSGAIAQDARFIQTVYGPGVTDQNGPRLPVDSLVWEAAQDCGTSAQSLLGTKGCGATFYQVDSNTIAVLRTTEKVDNGMTVQSKVFAMYSLAASDAAPTTTDKTVKTQPKKKRVPMKKPTKPATNGNPGQGNPGQGNPGQGNTVKAVTVKPATNGNPGQGNPGQGNPGQGNSTKVVVVPVKPVQPVVVATAPVVSSKTKIHVKEVEVKNTVAGDAVTKTKIDAKVKTNAETGVSKTKIDAKIKEVTPTTTTKVKLDEKTKTNVETGVSKEKTDLKIKEVTPETTTKVKFDEKVKTNSETGVTKEKTDLKIKETSEDGSSKLKIKVKVKKKGVSG